MPGAAPIATAVRSLRPEGSSPAFNRAFLRARDRIADDLELIWAGPVRRLRGVAADVAPVAEIAAHLRIVGDAYARDALIALTDEWHIAARARAALYRSVAAVVYAHIDAVAAETH
jgi:hypothetical protein